MRNFAVGVIAPGLMLLPLPLLAQEDDGVGTAEMVMTTTAEANAEAHFLEGLALLHNFEYARAASAFKAAQMADPQFVMAYWGEAMTHNHPLWEQQDRDAALAALSKLGSTSGHRAKSARSAKEQQWLAAVEALYGEGSKQDRDLAYLEKMRDMYASEKTDIDARAFYALAILGSSHGGRQIPLYMKAAGILEEGFVTHPSHPGILHYLIHSYDDPVHAPLGERAAARYAAIAPDAGHAQHMVSHIFHALGNWEASETANINADAVVDRQRIAMGREPTDCGHYNEWLAYSLAQQGKDASPIVEGCRAEAVAEFGRADEFGRTGGWRSASSSYANIALHWGIASGEWPTPVSWPPDNFLKAQFNMAYAELLKSRGDSDAVVAAQSEMERLYASLMDALPSEMPDEKTLPAWAERTIAQGQAIMTLEGGDIEQGLALLRAAAEAEAELPVVFGPPAIEKPSWELLGEELLALGRYKEAGQAFEKALAFSPGRLLARQGLETAGRAAAPGS